jgi:succinoglycan biosynthesis protein ExoV
MELVYWKGEHGNFGDDMNLWFWDDVMPGWRDWDKADLLLGIGSLLGTPIQNMEARARKLVLGSGSGYGEIPTLAPAAWDIRCVRGPRTARALGLPASVGITDGAVMAPRLARFATIARHEKVLFVPHHTTASDTDFDWEAICADAGVTLLSPCGDAETVIRTIAGARLVLAQSLHGAIVADAFRVPWRALRGGHFNAHKWADWAESMDVPLDVSPLFPLTSYYWRMKRRVLGGNAARTEREKPHAGKSPSAPRRVSRLERRLLAFDASRSLRLAARQEPVLSKDAVLADRQERFQDVIDGVVRDYA